MAMTRSVVPAVSVIVALAAVAVVLVASTLVRPELPEYPLTVPDPKEVGDGLVGPEIYTVEASAPDGWRFFDFSRGSVVESPAPREWDIAFQRFNIIVNGGEGFAGEGGALDLGDVPFEDVLRAPAEGYRANAVGRDSTNAVLRRWYDYGFASHLLTAKPRVYVVRTADGRFAKMQILSYYCPGARPGCVTFRYLYQGGGGADLSVR